MSHEIPLDEMMKRWSAPKVKEYRLPLAVSSTRTEGFPDEVIMELVRKMLEQSFLRTRKQHPEYNLTDWALVDEGPIDERGHQFAWYSIVLPQGEQ